MTPRDRLRQAFENAPRIAGSGAMDELTESGAKTLLGGGTTSELANALLDLWTDVDHRDDVQPRMLACGLLRSVEVWETLTVDGRMPTNVADAFDRLFASLAKHPDVLGGAAQDAFVEALLEGIGALIDTDAPLSDKALGWLAPACSVVALAPDSIERALAPLFVADDGRWRAALRFYAALGYPAGDHPWQSESTALWDRFGAEDAVWSTEAAGRLEKQLADALVRERLRDMTALATDEERDDVARICEELSELQMPTVWGSRRTCLLSRLTTSDPSPYWDDEMGIGEAH